MTRTKSIEFNFARYRVTSMKMNISTLFLVFVVLFCAATEANAQGKPMPNVIIILTDDHGYGDVGFNGCQDIPTPGIDRIATRGVVFTSGYVSYAVCGPSRAGLITGRYQDRFGFSRNPLFAPKDLTMGLPLNEETMADLLKKAGYSTAAFGKWHLGAHKELHPNKRGFDEFYGFLSGGHRYFPEELILSNGQGLKNQFDGYKTKLLHNTNRVEEKEYLTDAFSREARNFIRKHKDNPFFVYLAYNAPHAPLQASEKYLARFSAIQDKNRRTYAAMVSAVDDGVVGILDLLDELKLTENTIVFFLSDNGGPLKDNASSNGVLRGKKGDFYEGGIRVPFAVQWPGHLPAGIKYDKPVISLDIFATAAALSGTTPKNPIDGKNLIPFLTGSDKNPPHDFLYWRNFDQNSMAVRSTQNKMLLRKDAPEFFNIAVDISEKENLASSQHKSVNDLRIKLMKWKSLLADPAFLGLLQDEEYTKSRPDRWEIEEEF